MALPRLTVPLRRPQGATPACALAISEQRLAGSVRPHVEWANLKHQLTPVVRG